MEVLSSKSMGLVGRWVHKFGSFVLNKTSFFMASQYIVMTFTLFQRTLTWLTDALNNSLVTTPHLAPIRVKLLKQKLSFSLE